MKGFVAGLSTAFCYSFIFLSAFTFPFMNRWQLWQGPFGTFLLYALIALAGCLYVAFLAPPIDHQAKKPEDEAPSDRQKNKTENILSPMQK